MTLGAGPFVGGGTATGEKPPFGDGGLAINVANPQSSAVFGNEVDFRGDNVADLNDLGFRVFDTGENKNASGDNVPSISMEINPNGAGNTTTGFSTLVFNPKESLLPSNQWSPYIDATDDNSGLYGLTGSQFNSPATQDNCGLNGPRCTYSQIQAFLATGRGAKISDVQISKGRDFEFHGAVDGLRVNNKVYDFEPTGVTALAP